MRIIAGSARRLPLKTVSSREVRPTTDRIKETLFNILNPELSGCRFLDLFAGSGQMGLEAVSRGAEKAVFVENSKKAAACIEENMKFTKLADRCTLLVKDAVSAIRWMDGKEKFDLVFLDPPYGKNLEAEVLAALSETSLLERNAVIVAETALGTDFSQMEELGYQITREKTYKTNKHVFLRFESGDGGNR